MESNTQYSDVVKIDEHALDKECIRLPSDYLKFAHLAADARREADELKADMDVCVAELTSDVRSSPEDYGIEKVTESAINKTVAALPTLRSARRRYEKARHRQELVQAVVAALDVKKRTLTLLVELHGRGYYATPRISKEGKAAVEQISKDRVYRRCRHHEDNE